MDLRPGEGVNLRFFHGLCSRRCPHRARDLTARSPHFALPIIEVRDRFAKAARDTLYPTARAQAARCDGTGRATFLTRKQIVIPCFTGTGEYNVSAYKKNVGRNGAFACPAYLFAGSATPPFKKQIVFGGVCNHSKSTV